MTGTPLWLRPAFIVFLALLSFGLWFDEVCLMKGWEGLNWLSGYPWSALPICLAITLAAWIGTDSKKQRSAVRFIAFLVLTWGLLLLCFDLSRASLFALHSVGFLLYLPDLLRQGSLLDRLLTLGLFLGIPLAVLLASLGIYVLVRLFLQRISRWTILLLLAGLALIVPASIATIHVVPAINGSTDYLHAVKMGYPAFWAVILVGAAVMLGQILTKEGK